MIENDKTDITFNEAVYLCNSFNVSLDSFLDNSFLSAEDYIIISKRFVNYSNLSENDMRQLLKEIRLYFEKNSYDRDNDVNDFKQYLYFFNEFKKKYMYNYNLIL